MESTAVRGGFRELVQNWFTDTQASLILLQNGNFPDWFQGFTQRKDAEDQLIDKPVGCFLVRLSEKAVGYILSYRGQDRCRHFVINQDQAGMFIVTGDDQPHTSLRDLIEHYRASPIQPFGEYLTSTCSQSSSDELYDVVKFGAKEKNDPRNVQQNETCKPTALPPVLPTRSNNRKLTSTASTGRTSVSQHAVLPVPRQSQPLTLSLSGTLPDKSPSEIQYAVLHHSPQKIPSPSLTQYAKIHTIQNKVERQASTRSINHAMEPRSAEDTDCSHHDNRTSASTAPGGGLYSELTLFHSQSHSLSCLDKTTDEMREFSASPYSSDTPERASCQTYSPQESRGNLQTQVGTNRLYYSLVGHSVSQENPRGPPVQREEDSLYAEVPLKPNVIGYQTADDTYEQIPGAGGLKRTESTAPASQWNTFETLENRKSLESTVGKKNITWRKLFPEHKKK
ncbi:hypothetical protein DPEC_G00250100 [Dallia pectoralis]|uniref:Uncharacterized protein n=1 Tax=Dallia pectoralis TaxID=75939 RepID=A0ACC2FT70_DALPE|nr:hypothetical protein DPEC_G00250100 [Dallia pectoralis]